MSCKYNNSLYSTNPPEEEVCFDSFEELLLSEDYESQEELNNRLNEEYFQVYELTNDEMLEFARAGDEYYGACVKHLRYTTSIVLFNWTYIGEASLKLLNKSFRCFNGVPYERRTHKWEEWGEACIA